MMSPQDLIDLRTRLQEKLKQHAADMTGVWANDPDDDVAPVEIDVNDLKVLMRLLDRAIK